MKTIYNTIKVLAGVVLLASLAVSCVPEQQSMGDAGQTLIKLTPDGFTLIPLNAVSTPQVATAFIIRKNAHSEAALNTATTVVLKKDDAILTWYNTEEGTSFVPLGSLCTTSFTPGTDGTINLEFAAGDAAKAMIFTIPNATLFDFSKQYALAYRIESVSGPGIISEGTLDTIVVQVLVKNDYDGEYEVTAVTPMVDVANSAFTGYYPFTYELETSGANSVLCYDATVWGDYMHPMKNAGATSGYGSFGLEVFFDNTTRAITSVLNPWGNPPSNTRMPAIDPSGVNKWNASTGDIQFKYWMKQPSVVPAAPNIRVYFDEYWTYKGPR